MRNLCLYFQVHQPFRLRPYHFFDIGEHKHYFDQESNAEIMRKVARNCYLPANKLLLDLVQKYPGSFKVSFSISGLALDQFEKYTPQVLESFQQLAKSDSVEFIAETSAHSLAVLKSEQEFVHQVNQQIERIYKLFGKYPNTFRNTEMIYSNQIGTLVNQLGFEVMLLEGARAVLGWKSPNFLYCSATSPKLKLLLRNYSLSDDISFRFSNRGWKEFPLTISKYVDWINAIPAEEEIVNLFMDYETFGEYQRAASGIFEFLKALPGQVLSSSDFRFVTPSEAVRDIQPVAPLNVPSPISWADKEHDLSAWLGNDLQKDAFENLYHLEPKVRELNDDAILCDWNYLQASDHFYYMSTKYFSDGDVHKYFNPYHTPYEAFVNYMNVLNDFEMRLDELLLRQPPGHPKRVSKQVLKRYPQISKTRYRTTGLI